MLRIISGKYRGRKIVTTKNLNARPTMGIVRKSIFNIINSYMSLEGCKVLDLFSGSGSLTFEALSNGAKHSYIVDSEYSNLQLIKKTAISLDVIDDVTLICCEAEKISTAPTKCDIVFIDPPYESSESVELILNRLPETNWIKTGSLIVIEVKKNLNVNIPTSYQVFRKRVYGITKIIMLIYQNQYII